MHQGTTGIPPQGCELMLVTRYSCWPHAKSTQCRKADNQAISQQGKHSQPSRHIWCSSGLAAQCWALLTAGQPPEAMQWQETRGVECRTVSYCRKISITLGYMHITQDPITIGLLCHSPFPLILKEPQRLQFLSTVSLKNTFSTADPLC